MEHLSPEQIQRLNNTNRKKFTEHCKEAYVHDLNYYQTYLLPVIQHNAKQNRKTNWIVFVVIFTVLFLTGTSILYLIYVDYSNEKEKQADLKNSKEMTIQSVAEHNVTSYIKSNPDKFPEFIPGKFGKAYTVDNSGIEVSYSYQITKNGKSINKFSYFTIDSKYDIVNIVDR